MTLELLIQKLDELFEPYLDVWEDVCNIESPTKYKAGVDACGELFAKMAEERGWKVEYFRQSVAGDLVDITLNPDAEVVKMVKEGLAARGGYCPCRLEKTEDNKCICKEFREQIADPDFKGYCHCFLYYKD